MKFYKNLIRTFNDLPEYTSVLIHSLVGCNFYCYGCHNYGEIVAKKHSEFFTSEDIIEQIKLNGFLFNAIIFSGGEFLIEDFNSITKLLKELRVIFDGKIIINTNGSFPDKIKYLLEFQLVDGFHIDMKLPYHALDINKDQEIYKSIIGFKPSQRLINNMLSSIELIIENNSPISQVRTVKYPILDQDFFSEIESYIVQLNKKFNSNVTYKLNEFLIKTNT
ncbi:radical SAM protein [Vulcanibacillus modesticaldus]|uniref:Radical SAM protein n=1 Tax=Vulcanibacillus modesticaldus TaxID=337097 RepID=A0A1D2YX55_9BACI|nr:radical SAM protein [Vulcanibacillus modesticaldus]OEG00345.1 radical SAM protein [Vulcanibacillus modesticaldus]